MKATRNRPSSMTGNIQPQNRGRHTMASTQVQFLLVSLCILATQTTKGVFGGVNSGPLNRVVYEGATNTTFTCQLTRLNQKWTLLPFAFTGNSSEVFPANNGGLNPSLNDSFAIDRSQGAFVYTLVVLNATIATSDRAHFSTAGVYICEDTEGQFFSQLVVIRTDPICSSNFTQSTAMLQSGDVIQLSCTIVYGAIRDPLFTYSFHGYGEQDYYHGIIDAVMTWSVNGEAIPTDNATFTKNSSPTEVTASSTLLITDNFDATYECQTTFSPPSGTLPPTGEGLASMATNAPDYFKTCTISLSVLPTTSSPTVTTTQPTSTTTTKTSSAPAHTTTAELPPCGRPDILDLLISLLLLPSCYDDWISCSLVGNLLQICPNHCKSLHFSGGTCMPSTSVGCPCIPPGNKKCHCA